MSTAVALSFGFDQEVAAVNYLLKGLSTSPALLSGDIKGFYDQLKATPVPDGSWLLLQDLEGQVINTLRPFGTPLPRGAHGSSKFPGADHQTTYRDRRWSVSGRLIGPLTRSTVIALSLRIDGPDRAVEDGDYDDLGGAAPVSTPRRAENTRRLDEGAL